MFTRSLAFYIFGGMNMNVHVNSYPLGFTRIETMLFKSI